MPPKTGLAIESTPDNALSPSEGVEAPKLTVVADTQVQTTTLVGEVVCWRPGSIHFQEDGGFEPITVPEDMVGPFSDLKADQTRAAKLKLSVTDNVCRVIEVNLV